MKKTLVLLAVLVSAVACNKDNGGNNNNAPVTPSNYAATPNSCNNSVPTSACVPYNSGYNNYYGQGGYYGYNQNQNFYRNYMQNPTACPPGSMPVVGGPGQYLCMSYIYMWQQQIIPSQVPGAYIQGGVPGPQGGQVPPDYNSYIQQQQQQSQMQQQGQQEPTQYSGQRYAAHRRGMSQPPQRCNISQGPDGCGGGNLVCVPSEPSPQDSSLLTGSGTCQPVN